MGRFAVAVTCGSLALWSGVADAHAGGRRPTCGPGTRHSETVAHRGQVRIYWVEHAGFTWYRACSPGRKPVQLAEYEDGGAHFVDYADTFRVAGHFVAFAHRGSFDSDRRFDVVVVDLRRRRQTTVEQLDPRELAALYVTDGGTAAYVAESEDTRVLLTKSGAGTSELDRGAMTEVRLRGHTLSWRHDGEQRSAELR